MTDERLSVSFVHSYEMMLKHIMLSCSVERNQQIMRTFSVLDFTGFSISMMNSRVYGLVQMASKIS